LRRCCIRRGRLNGDGLGLRGRTRFFERAQVLRRARPPACDHCIGRIAVGRSKTKASGTDASANIKTMPPAYRQPATRRPFAGTARREGAPTACEAAPPARAEALPRARDMLVSVRELFVRARSKVHGEESDGFGFSVGILGAPIPNPMFTA